MAVHARAWWYHPTEAPTGRLFDTAAEQDALGPDWVDTPAKFPVVNFHVEVVDGPGPADLTPLEAPKRRGRQSRVPE